MLDNHPTQGWGQVGTCLGLRPQQEELDGKQREELGQVLRHGLQHSKSLPVACGTSIRAPQASRTRPKRPAFSCRRAR
jgi:hypothetical protein